MKTKFVVSVVAASLSLTFQSITSAHDIVLVPESNQIRVRLGHPGDWQPVDKEKLLELKVISDPAMPADLYTGLKRQGLDYVVPFKSGAGSKASITAARYDNGLWVELPAVGQAKPEWRNASRFMLPQAKDVMASVKFAKSYVGTVKDGSVFSTKTGHLLELIPQANPYAVKPSQTLPVLVLYNGQPLVDAKVEVSNLKDKLPEDKIPRYSTDSNGIAQVRLRTIGVNTIAVDLKKPKDASLGPNAVALPVEAIMMVATYTFIR